MLQFITKDHILDPVKVPYSDEDYIISGNTYCEGRPCKTVYLSKDNECIQYLPEVTIQYYQNEGLKYTVESWHYGSNGIKERVCYTMDSAGAILEVSAFSV